MSNGELTQKYFINILKKYIRDDNELETPRLDRSKLMTQLFYLEHIWKKGNGGAFTWDVKQDITIMEHDKTLEWIKETAKKSELLMPSDISPCLTQEWVQYVQELEGVTGVYSFWSEADYPLYIGMSRDLGNRISSSFTRLNSYHCNVWGRVIETKTLSDAIVLEAYLICKYKPVLNSKGNTSEELTLALEKEPEWPERLQVTSIPLDKQDELKRLIGELTQI